VAFTGTVSIGDAVPTGVFAASGGAVSMIAKEGDAAPNGVFSSFREVAVDGSRVAFLGTYNNLNDEGIFLREPGGGLMPLIKEGDSLFGSTVRFLEISRFGFDDDGSGELGFAYGLTDGRRGIALATQTAAADFDANGYVDSDDLDAWRTNFGMAGGAASTHGDADGDGAVTGADFLIWQRQLGGAGFPSPVQSAPEPLSIVLSVLGLGGGQLSRPGRRQQDSRGDRRRRVR
jgi:hypothetical protein